MSGLARNLLPFVSLLLLVVLLSVLRPDTFLTAENFENVLRRSSVNGIIAAGMTAVIISGGIDLSVGSMLALCGMAGAWVMMRVSGSETELSDWGMLAGTLAGVGVGAACGALNGLLITGLRLAPFIVTLGTMSAFRGLAQLANDGQPLNLADYRYLNEAHWLGVPASIMLFGAVVVAAAAVLRYTALGRYTYAIGSNREAAFHAGVRVGRTLLWIYALTGAATGLAAMITASRAVSAQPSAGFTLELDVIAAVVIGGASLSGGRGSILGTVVGALLIGFLRNGCTLLDISPHLQLVVIGAIIIAAVAVDQTARGRG